MIDAARIQALVPELYRLVTELEAAAPGRSFAPDGHLLGSIGEVLAAARYGLTLTTASTKGVDAIAPDGRKVEIKATAGRVIGLRGCPPHLLVLKLEKDGSSVTIYNGPVQPVWAALGSRKVPSNGQRQVSLARLRELQTSVPIVEIIPVAGQEAEDWGWCGTSELLKGQPQGAE